MNSSQSSPHAPFTIRIAALALAAALTTTALPTINAESKPLTLKMVRMNGYRSQDSIRDSLRYALCQVHDHDLSFWAREYPINGSFFDRASINEAQIQKKHPPLHYKIWMQTAKAPLVIILPGMGGHYQGAGLNALAQTYFDSGHSVLLVSSSMNWEFYVAACTSKVPGYPPLDAKDIRYALRKIITKIKNEHPGEIISTHLVGLSLGAVHTLFIAKLESESNKKIGFKSYLAIHPPIDIINALTTLDDFFAKWRKWPKKKVSLNIEKAAAVYLALTKKGLPSNKKVNVDKNAAEVLIATSYRYALRELLLAIKKDGNDMGLIKTPYGFKKNDLYRELDAFSFQDYAEKFLKKSIEAKLGKSLSMKELAENGSLHSISPFLAKAENVKVINSMNDFLVPRKKLKWFAKTFGDRALFFEYGGHLGELYTKQAKKAIVEYLTTIEKVK